MQPVKILVVDDESDLEFLITKKYNTRIRQQEWEFLFASHGVAALDVLATEDGIAIALLDINMPTMDGLTLLAHIRDRYPLICPIMVTAYHDMHHIRKAIQLKVYDFLTKPINFPLLEATLDRAIQNITTLTQEINARQEAEKALEEERNLLKTILNAIPDTLYVKDAQGRFLLKNANSGVTVPDDFSEALATQSAAVDQWVVNTGQPIVNREEMYIHPVTHEPQWFLTSKVPLRDQQGRIAGVVSMARDLTTIKRHQEHLHASQRQYAALAEAMADGIAIVQNDRFVFVNTTLCSILGSTAEQFGQLVPQAIFHAESDSASDKATGSWHVLHTARDGREIWLETHTNPILWEEKPAALYTIRDITAYKLYELRLEQEEAYLIEENMALKGILHDSTRFGDLIGGSAAMQRVYALILQAAKNDQPILITGESGTGKELVAKTIHQLSSRRQHRFVPVNCAAIPANLFESELFGHRKGAFTGAISDTSGAFEHASQGTLFLDEIGELPPEQQAKFLRVLSSEEYKPLGSAVFKHANARIVAASHRNLAEMVKAGTFREDLFYRLDVIEVHVPPLRERKEDLALLITFFLEHFAPSHTLKHLPSKMFTQLYAHSWPGNIRELQNVVA